ncbi:hypothetical protein [Amycolatopsis sp.]|uniref:hypothetical protein n=1 Tax=Amycolatopsis sp. TaxID=37632 RepID=UPI002BE221FA|nr:hypothetical protein [Amycolatopsis sp.]HVV09554.1 hypothetical protein [Amycolatopsis sp.]
MTEPITASNSTTGAGAIDSWHSVASSIEEIKTAHGADAAAIGVEIGVTVVGAVADTVALALDPLAKLAAAGIGWLIEHISFLKEPLDQIAGDPAEVSKLAVQLHKIAETLRSASTDMDSALKAQITGWKGDGYDAFKGEITARKGQLDDAGHAVDTAGYVVETTGALITAVRSLIRDLISTVLGDIIATMLVALAMAIWTFGASIVAGVATSVALAVAQAVSMAAKLAKVVGLGGRTASRLEKLADSIKNSVKKDDSIELPDRPPATGSGTHEDGSSTTSGTHDEEAPPVSQHDDETSSTNSGTHDDGSSTHDDDSVFNDWLNADNQLNGPHEPPTPGSPHDDAGSTHSTPHDDETGSTPHDDDTTTPPHDETPDDSTTTSGDHTGDTPADTPAGPSPFKPAEVGWMKKHEDWLKGASWDKVKFVENWVKTNPKLKEYYPVIKGIADAKSSKNYVGWGGKTAINLDKALTDIQMQADAAWAESGQQWREEHPDPAAEQKG